MGHTVMALRSTTDLESAIVALAQQGFAPAEIVTYSPLEMAQLARSERKAASPLAAFGYELELLDTHLALAESGCSFLVVPAPDEALVTRVAEVALLHNAASAQHYGRFMIEDLINSTAPNAPTLDTPTPVR
nr:hypothetical protein [Rhodoferax sp.]